MRQVKINTTKEKVTNLVETKVTKETPMDLDIVHFNNYDSLRINGFYVANIYSNGVFMLSRQWLKEVGLDTLKISDGLTGYSKQDKNSIYIRL